MTYIKNLWYVAAWASELNDKPLACTVIEEPLVLYRRKNGDIAAMEDRCPHRHAPLSLGRIEGDDLRCMYHGMKFNPTGQCISLPGNGTTPMAQARSFPVVESADWIWVWMGDPAKADRALVPSAFGTTNPDYTMVEGAINYDANYELINDNLTDLSHVDFVHETTLGAASGTKFADDLPKVKSIDSGLLISRWFQSHPIMGEGILVDTYNDYTYRLPGVFVMRSRFYPEGTAKAAQFGPPSDQAIFERVEQQAVTPLAEKQTRYFYATGVASKFVTPGLIESMSSVIDAAFAEDRCMIEGQQHIWNQTGAGQQKVFIPQDKAPFLFRQLIQRRLAAETHQP